MTQAKDFPPQAYTKETVSEAFMWLQSQPDEVKKMATHTSQLVSLYLKDKCQQYWASKTNASSNENGNIHSFNDQLQKMALEMTPLTHTDKNSHTHLNGNSLTSNGKDIETPSTNCFTVPKSEHGTSSSHSLNGSASNSMPSDFISQDDMQNQKTLSSMDTKSDFKQILDAKSLEALEDTKVKLNLSSHVEAARALITLGFEQVKSLFSSK